MPWILRYSPGPKHSIPWRSSTAFTPGSLLPDVLAEIRSDSIPVTSLVSIHTLLQSLVPADTNGVKPSTWLLIISPPWADSGSPGEESGAVLATLCTFNCPDDP